MNNLRINRWEAWEIKEESFFISKDDETGTIWIANRSELKDLEELIKRVKKELKEHE